MNSLTSARATPSPRVSADDLPALSVSGIRKRYGTHDVLRDVTFDVLAGQVFALLGPNGAGKTTLIRILTTLIEADGGAGRILGHDLARESARVRELISVTGQYASVDEELTGLENLVMIGQLLGMRKKAAHKRAQELLVDFDLVDAARRRVGQYSGGMRRRLDLAAYILVFTLIAAAWGLAARSVDSAGMFSFIALFLPYLSTAFIPTEHLPEFLQGFAENQPVTLVIESFRSLALGAPDINAITGSIIWLVGLGLVATILTSWCFGRAARR